MNRIGNSITIVCYDITSNKLRNKIDKCMKDFGTRIQFSVFLCRLDAGGVVRCREKLLGILDKFAELKKPDDSLIIFKQFQRDKVDCLLGEKIERTAPKFLIV